MHAIENYSEEENNAEQHFISTHRRDQNERFIVQMPVINGVISLGDSMKMATKRFFNTEKRLNQDRELKQKYINFMREYCEVGHMKLIPNNEISNCSNYYLPHHAVKKDSKLRVVFDAMAKA